MDAPMPAKPVMSAERLVQCKKLVSDNDTEHLRELLALGWSSAELGLLFFVGVLSAPPKSQASFEVLLSCLERISTDCTRGPHGLSVLHLLSAWSACRKGEEAVLQQRLHALCGYQVTIFTCNDAGHSALAWLLTQYLHNKCDQSMDELELDLCVTKYGVAASTAVWALSAQRHDAFATADLVRARQRPVNTYEGAPSWGNDKALCLLAVDLLGVPVSSVSRTVGTLRDQDSSEMGRRKEADPYWLAWYLMRMWSPTTEQWTRLLAHSWLLHWPAAHRVTLEASDPVHQAMLAKHADAAQWALERGFRPQWPAKLAKYAQSECLIGPLCRAGLLTAEVADAVVETVVQQCNRKGTGDLDQWLAAALWQGGRFTVQDVDVLLSAGASVSKLVRAMGRGAMYDSQQAVRYVRDRLMDGGAQGADDRDDRGRPVALYSAWWQVLAALYRWGVEGRPETLLPEAMFRSGSRQGEVRREGMRSVLAVSRQNMSLMRQLPDLLCDAAESVGVYFAADVAPIVAEFLHGKEGKRECNAALIRLYDRQKKDADVMELD